MKFHSAKIHACFIAAVFLLGATFFSRATEADAQLLSSSRAVHYPAEGLWNGFNNHLNVVECSNHGSPEVRVNLFVYSNSGTLLGAAPLAIGSLGTVHFTLNAFPIANDYGLYRLEVDPSSPSPGSFLRCTTVVYRFAPPGSPIPLTYAYALPNLDPQQGTTWGYFNSFNPDGLAEPSPNWLSVANAGTSDFSATVDLFDINGVTLGQFSVNQLPALRRFDFPLGHPSGQIVGLYRITPQSGSAPYFAFNTAYGSRGGAPYYAYPLYASKSGCPSEPVFVSTFGPANNWAQVGNAGSVPLTVELRYRANTGALLKTESRTIAPRAQQHIFLNAIFGDNNIGTLEARCSNAADPLLLQNTFYIRDNSNRISWAYATQQRGMRSSGAEISVAPVNSFLGGTNWLRAVDSGLQSASIAARVNTYSSIESLSFAAPAPAGTTIDIPLFTLFPPDTVGAAQADLAPSAQMQSMETIRVFADAAGKISGIFNVPSAIVSGQVPQASLVPVAVSLDTPVGITNAKDGTGRLFIPELAGRIRILNPNGTVVNYFLDITDRVRTGGEQGLIGLAFHPNYQSNGRFFVHYISQANGNSTVSEFSALGTPNDASESSERIVISIPQTGFTNHKGGQLAFGPDGKLYIALGDGGSGGDPGNRAQNPALLLGKILRIDVDGAQPYTVPADNPFVGVSGFRPEIWALGFRNPYRFSFDSVSGRLFLADVGQSAREEIDIVTKGGNYGWRIMEGTFCYNPPANCPMGGLTLPIHDYGRDQGVSVIGGFVYRGNLQSAAYGKYIFGDFGSGRIWSLEQLADGRWARTELLETGGSISSLGEGEDGELFVVFIDGTISRLQLP